MAVPGAHNQYEEVSLLFYGLHAVLYSIETGVDGERLILRENWLKSKRPRKIANINADLSQIVTC